MANFNKVILVGNLTKDPELKHLASGVACCEFSMAYNESYTKDGQKVEKVHFFDIVAWKQTGELVAKFLRKGSGCLIEGSLTQDRWEDATTQQKRSRIKINAQRVQFLGKPSGQGEQGAAEEAPAEAGTEF
jgi:single-strand DNA-binding protein